jgi:predicted dehydrogenase
MRPGPLRLAVVGAGERARIALHAVAAGERIVAVVEPDPHRHAAARERFGPDVEILTGIDGLSELRIDAAFVTSPDDTHAAAASSLLSRGIHVYLEKPLALTADDCDAVLRAARDGGARLYVGHNMRHMAVARLMRELVERGEIGEVRAVWCRHFVGNGGDYYFKDWHAERARTGGLLLQKGAHDIDVIHWLAGGHTRRVVGMGGLSVYNRVSSRRDNSDRTMSEWFSHENWPPLEQRDLHPVIDVEDLSMMLMDLDNGVQASYEQCHYTPDYWRSYTVIGTEGRLENFGDGDGGVVRVWNRRTTYSPDGDAAYPIVGDADGHGDADALTVAEFIAFVRHGTPTETSPVSARNAVAAAAAATRSLRAGSAPVEVRPLPADLAEHFARHQNPDHRPPGQHGTR